jgi:hypothetical protein
MTRTSLSATTSASPEAQRVYSAPQRCLEAASSLARDARRFQWHRHSCLPRGMKGLRAVAKPLPQQRAKATLSLPSKFLIANPRLTLRVNAIRIEPSSRRENVLVAQALLPVRCCQDFEPHGISFQNLIVTPRLEITISPILSISSNFLIVTKRTFFHPDSFAGADFCTLRPPKTRIQCGREGESV